MTLRLVLCTLFACIFAAGYQSQASSSLVKVYVVSGSDGFTAPGAGDSSADLVKSMRRKAKMIQVVDTQAEAQVVVRITSRNEVSKVDSFTTYKDKSKDGKQETSRTVPTEETQRIVHAKLQAGDFVVDLQGQGSFWSGAADKLAGQIDRWVKQNYARLTESRLDTTSGPAQQAPRVVAAAEGTTGTGDVTITPGMTPEQVTEKMGEPSKKITFGQKSLGTIEVARWFSRMVELPT